MLLTGTLLALASWLVAPAQAGPYPPDEVDQLAATGIVNLSRYLGNQTTPNACTLEKAARRYEWSDLSPAQRENYIAAVLCLQAQSPRSDPAAVPGARSRFDDFVAVHINLTLSIHATANFLSWHRYYTWLYEQALREECGYEGHQPYWNWGRYASDPLSSPLFNGNASSMSGNGAKYDYEGVSLSLFSPPYDVIPPDQGGGCVTEGPFKDMTVNLGPVFPGSSTLNVPANPQTDGMGYNPRCLRRDINKYSAAVTATNYTHVLIENSPDIGTFQDTMQGLVRNDDWGVHTGGHYTIGGDPGGDFYTSPGDPAFYLHHAQIDRVWWIWQNQQLPARLSAIAGTITIVNQPPSRNGTLDDVLDVGAALGPPVRLGDVLRTTGGLEGNLCYVYV